MEKHKNKCDVSPAHPRLAPSPYGPRGSLHALTNDIIRDAKKPSNFANICTHFSETTSHIGLQIRKGFGLGRMGIMHTKSYLNKTRSAKLSLQWSLPTVTFPVCPKTCIIAGAHSPCPDWKDRTASPSADTLTVCPG